MKLTNKMGVCILPAVMSLILSSCVKDVDKGYEDVTFRPGEIEKVVYGRSYVHFDCIRTEYSEVQSLAQPDPTDSLYTIMQCEWLTVRQRVGSNAVHLTFDPEVFSNYNKIYLEGMAGFYEKATIKVTRKDK